MMTTEPSPRVPWLALASGPPLLAACLVALYLVAEAVVPGVVTAPRPENLAEAVVRENLPATIEWLQAGAPIDAEQRIRQGLFDSREYLVTPLEASLMARRADFVRLLRDAGATSRQTPRSACLAQTLLPQALPMLGWDALPPLEGSLEDCFQQQP